MMHHAVILSGTVILCSVAVCGFTVKVLVQLYMTQLR